MNQTSEAVENVSAISWNNLACHSTMLNNVFITDNIPHCIDMTFII